MIKQVKKRLKEKDIVLEVSNAVRGLLIEEGYDPIYGARPLPRAVTRILEDNLAEQCLLYTMHPGTILRIDRVLDDSKQSTYELKYKNEIKVHIDYSNVSQHLLDEAN